MLKAAPLSGFSRDRRGVAAVEFAFIAPLCILVFFGTAQLSQAVIANRHIAHAATSLGDLVSQCANINDQDLTNIFNAGPDIMTPLPAGSTLLGQRVTSVQAMDNNGAAQAQWSQAADTAGLTTAYTPGASVSLPANIVSNKGDSVIMAESVYLYTFPFTTGGVLPLGAGQSTSLSFGQSITFDKVTYFKPRRSYVVSYTGTGPGGSGQSTGVEGISCYAG